MKKHILVPSAFLIGGLAFYVYYGITWNAWLSNLPNLAFYLVIIIALGWALKKKEELKQNRNY